MSKIIFLDVDGTLIDYEAKLPASAAQAVNQHVQMDIKFIFVQVVQKLKLNRETFVN